MSVELNSGKVNEIPHAISRRKFLAVTATGLILPGCITPPTSTDRNPRNELTINYGAVSAMSGNVLYSIICGSWGDGLLWEEPRYDVVKTTPDGSDKFLVTKYGAGRDPNAQWSPSGEMISTIEVDTLYKAGDLRAVLFGIYDKDGNKTHRLNARGPFRVEDRNNNKERIGDLKWAQDSRSVLISDIKGVYEYDLGSKISKDLVARYDKSWRDWLYSPSAFSRIASQPLLSPDRGTLVFRYGGCFVADLNAKREPYQIGLESEKVEVTDGIYELDKSVSPYNWTKDNRLIVSHNTQTKFYDLKSKSLTTIGDGTASLNKDGDLIAMNSGDSIGIFDLNGKVIQDFKSPIRGRLTFVSNDKLCIVSNRSLYSVNVDGTGLVKVLEVGKHNNPDAGWSDLPIQFDVSKV